MERYHKERVKKADKARKSQEEEARLKEQEELELAIALSLGTSRVRRTLVSEGSPF